MDPIANLNEQKRLYTRWLAFQHKEDGASWSEADNERWHDLKEALGGWRGFRPDTSDLPFIPYA